MEETRKCQWSWVFKTQLQVSGGSRREKGKNFLFEIIKMSKNCTFYRISGLMKKKKLDLKKF